MSAVHLLLHSAVVDDHGGDARPRRIGLQPHRLGVDQQLHVVVLQRRPDPQHLGVGFGVHDAGEAVAVGAAHAGAVGHVALVEHDPARGVERVVAQRRQVVGQLLDPGLVRHGGERIRPAGARLGRILPTGAVHAVELLGQGVVRLHHVVADRPRRRHAVMVAQLAEILLAQPVERRSVELGGAADAVVDLRLELLAVGIAPRVGGHVAVLDEDLVGRDVLGLAREPAPAFQQQDPLARRGEMTSQRPAARAGSDDDDVVVGHETASYRAGGMERLSVAEVAGPRPSRASSSARMIRAAASMSARCENAWGKLPRWRSVSASNSSA